MLHVVMKDGRVLRYNRCKSFTADALWVQLKASSLSEAVIAKIASHDIERLEYEKPCKITDKRGRNVKVNY